MYSLSLCFISAACFQRFLLLQSKLMLKIPPTLVCVVVIVIATHNRKQLYRAVFILHRLDIAMIWWLYIGYGN